MSKGVKKNLDKIDWKILSENQNSIDILEKNLHKIDWSHVSTNPNAMDILRKNQDKIGWNELSSNPSIFELDYSALKEHCAIYKEELIKIALHPSRIQKILDLGLEIEDLDDYI